MGSTATSCRARIGVSTVSDHDEERRLQSNDLAEVRKTLWKAADELRANSSLAPAEYRSPVLGLIFLAYAEHRFEEVRPEVEARSTARRPITADDYRARSVLFVPDEARLSHLVGLPEAANLGQALGDWCLSPRGGATAFVIVRKNAVAGEAFFPWGVA